jgi:hypothetical protein
MRAGRAIRTVGLAVAVMLMALVPRATSASPVLNVLADCSATTCFGATYQLIIDDGGTTDTNYLATLIIDTTGYNGGESFISSVDFKVSNTVSSATLTSAPGNLANWTTVINLGQAGGNCSSSGGGFVTSCDFATVAEAPVGGLLTWAWNFSTSSPISFGHMGAKYNNSAGTTPGQLVSISTVHQVPEPTSLSLLGLGLFFLAAVGSRRLTRQAK